VRVLVHAPGPPGHGVVRHAAQVVELVRAHGVVTARRDVELTHVQFTDALFGPDIGRAAGAFEAWAAAAPRPLLVTLHDVPGADADPARDARRGRGYARVVAMCDAVVVSAEHEAGKVARLTGRTATVVELPVREPVPGGARPAWSDRPTVGVLGFVYAGKGHDVAIEAAARRSLRPRVVAAGSGPADLVRGLHTLAAARGVDLVVTGPLSDADMAAAAAAVTVPLAPGRAVSASGSLATWLGCGRRPLVGCGEYAVEVERRHPGVLHLYADGTGLDAALSRALADPSHTRLGTRPVWTDVGAAHAALYRRIAAC